MHTCKVMSPLLHPVILMRPDREPHSHETKELVNRILSIAPILPRQKHKSTSEPEPKHHQPKATNDDPVPAATEVKSTAHTPAPAPTHLSVNANQEDNLIDFDSRPPSVAPPEPATKPTKEDPIAGNVLHDTKNPQPTPVHQSTTLNAPVGNPPKTANLMDDDDHLSGVNNQVSNLSLQQPMVPQGRGPLQRMDTDTSEVDVFVDAEG